MKSFMDKFFPDIPLGIPLFDHSFCSMDLLFPLFFYRPFELEADAISYADHISFYTDNLSKGVFPLWDPAWFNGAPVSFLFKADRGCQSASFFDRPA